KPTEEPPPQVAPPVVPPGTPPVAPPVVPPGAPEPEPGEEVLEITDATIVPDEPAVPRTGSRSSIDLGSEVPASGSGGESFVWEELVGHPGPSSHGTEATFDSPSDVEILG